MKFTDEQLRECAAQGMYASQIAKRFNTSRQAVWSRVHKLAQQDSGFTLPRAHRGPAPKVTKADLLDAQHLGQTIREAAESLGVSYDCVRSGCRREGVALKSRNGPPLGNSVNVGITMPAPVLDAATEYAKNIGWSRSRLISEVMDDWLVYRGPLRGDN